MTYRVKVIGAGSIGNHLSQAARSLGWSVDLCDLDEAALERTRQDIYPARYGAWDEAIRLMAPNEAESGAYDLIFVGTPPDSHMRLAIDAVKERPKAVLVEKPLCTPDMEGADELWSLSRDLDVPVFCGYDHVVGAASRRVTKLLGDGAIGNLLTLDVEFREHWGGIFGAHPWLDGPRDTYLGFWRRGGGASGEHSHAANLWQHFAHAAGAGRVVEVTAQLDFVNDGTVDYDRLCIAHLRTESGLIGRIVQDVITRPARKWARAQGDQGFVEWHCGYKPGCDVVLRGIADLEPEMEEIRKTRPDDFIHELRHIREVIENGTNAPDISLGRGIHTMRVVAAMHRSAQEKRTIRIEYD